MDERIPRRAALRRLVVLSAGLFAGCSRKPTCMDVTGLSPEDLKTRNELAAYTELAPDPSKKCSVCAQWVAAPSPTSCGGCKVVKGPINADGTCRLFVGKTD
jgi:hypothetical protein